MYEETDIMECSCGNIVDKLQEFSDTDVVIRGDLNADGRSNWGPLGRHRLPPVTSPYPVDRNFNHVGTKAFN